MNGASVWVHATAAVVGEAGVLLRGPSGSGKTSVALRLVAEAHRDRLFARLVADDRVGLAPYGERLVARPHSRTAGFVERRGIGIAAEPHEPACVVRLVVDLVPPTDVPPPRYPEPNQTRTAIAGVALPLLRLRSDASPCSNVGLILHRLAAPLASDGKPSI